MNEQAFVEDTHGVAKGFNPPRWVDANNGAEYILCGWLSRT